MKLMGLLSVALLPSIQNQLNLIVILMVKVNKNSLTKMSFSKEDQPILCLRYKSNQNKSWSNTIVPSDGSVHSYSPGLGCWLLLQPTRTAATNVKLNQVEPDSSFLPAAMFVKILAFFQLLILNFQPAAFAGTQPLAKLASTSSGVVIKVVISVFA